MTNYRCPECEVPVDGHVDGRYICPECEEAWREPRVCPHENWDHIETTENTRYVPPGILKISECEDCGTTKEETYTLASRVIDGAEVRI